MPFFDYDELARKKFGVVLPRGVDPEVPIADAMSLPRDHEGKPKKMAEHDAEGLVVVRPPADTRTSWMSAQRHLLAPVSGSRKRIREEIEKLLEKRTFVLFWDTATKAQSPVRFVIYPPITDDQAGKAIRSCGFDSKLQGDRSMLSSYALLTRTSKMSCFSFNLPAGPPSLLGTCPGASLGFMYLSSSELIRNQMAKSLPQEIDPAPFICNGCFALKGQYGNPSNVFGMQARLMLIRWFLNRRAGWRVPKNVYFLTREETKSLHAASNLQELARRAMKQFRPATGMSLKDLFVYAIRAGQQKSVEEQQELEEFGFTAGEFEEAERRATVIKEWTSLKPDVRKRFTAEGRRPVELKAYYQWEVPDPAYFRIHDAGDMGWAPAYAETWLEVCRELDDIMFWAPTRAWAIGSPEKGEKKALPPSMLRRVPPNLALRPSSLHFRTPPPSKAELESIGFPVAGSKGGGLAAGSGAARGALPRGAWGCPAYLHWSAGGGALIAKNDDAEEEEQAEGVGGTCALARGPSPGCSDPKENKWSRGCRVCWGDRGCIGRPVYYHEH